MSWDDWGYWDDSSGDEYMGQRHQVYDPYADVRAKMEPYEAQLAQKQAEEDRMVEQFRQNDPEEAKAIEDTVRKYTSYPSFLGPGISSDVLERDLQRDVRRGILRRARLMAAREHRLQTLKPSQDPEEIGFFSDVLQLLRTTL